MGIKIVTYGGRMGWFFRKHFSVITSDVYLETQYLIRKGLFKRYIEWFNSSSQISMWGDIPQPCLVSIETINRCNSTCDFCPANKNVELRPFQIMEENLYHNIIGQLEELEYDGYLNLYVNNEPLIDKRIEEWYDYAKNKLPNAKLLLYTNGTLMTVERFEKLARVIDKMIINNYSEDLKLHDNIRKIYNLVKNDNKYRSCDITIQIRYIHEILTNRAGGAPNKAVRHSDHKMCIMPFTDVTIYPNGTVGLCCNDAREVTCLGDLKKYPLVEIWRSEKYKKIRECIGKDRDIYDFCKGCDFVDAGIRNMFMKKKMDNLF